MVRFGCASALVALLWAGAAAAQITPYNSKDWSERPSEAEIAAAWPKSAKPGIYESTVFLLCAVAQGAVADCTVAQEDAPGQGFGAAALGLSPRFKLKGAPKDPAAKALVAVNFRAPGYAPPTWARLPRRENYAAVTPRAALEKGLGGAATLRCKVDLQGSLSDCSVVAEDPPGIGFGSAAIILTRQLAMKPATLNGAPVVATALVPIVFPGLKSTDAIETGSRVRPNQTEFMSDRILSAVMAWPEAPTYADVAAAYPAEARAKKLGGRATLDCIFTTAGRLTGCTTAQEEPRGEGFSSAATPLAKLFRAEAKTPNGDSVARAHVQLPIAFTPDMLAAEPPVLSRPTFAVTPEPEDVAGAFPPAARAAGVATGRGVLACKVQQAGALACQVQSEEPAGYGFGDAALKVAPLFRVQTWGADGVPIVGRTVKLAMRFDRPEEAPGGAP